MGVCVSEAHAAVIRTAFEQRGELSAVGELRRLFPALAASRWLESASAPLLAGTRCQSSCQRETRHSSGGFNRLSLCPTGCPVVGLPWTIAIRVPKFTAIADNGHRALATERYDCAPARPSGGNGV